MTSNSFAARHAALLAILDRLPDPQDRLTWVVEQARLRPPFPPAWRTDDHRVKGCAARLWLRASLDAGRCRFACDSDSAILQAAAGLLCALYDGLPPTEVIANEPAFLETTRLMGQFTENRRRTIQRVREAIRGFAEEWTLPAG